VTVTYADASVLVRAYMLDEPLHQRAKAMVFGGMGVVSSEIAALEFTSALSRAATGGRVRTSKRLVQAFEQDCAAEGPISLLPFEPAPVFAATRRLVAGHALRTLDALHLAVAMTDGRAAAGTGALLFATFDAQQARAARAEGLRVV
jgi:hypothetical protein